MAVFSKIKVDQCLSKITEAKSIVIVAHKSPDGDSIGSSSALYSYLMKKGYKAKMVMPDPCPAFLDWLPGAESIVNADNHPDEAQSIIANADLIFCLDFNEVSRVGNVMQPWISGATGFKIMIDHHLYPSSEFDVLFSDITSCSTAQLIYEFIEACGDKDVIDTTIAAGIYCGIMTDSGSFRFPSTTPKTHEVAAHLLSVGLQHSSIYESVYDTNTVERLKLRGFAINEKLEILPEIKTAIISLTKEELVRFRYQRGDTEGLVNVGLSIIGVNKSIFLSEAEGYVKMSFRSKGADNPINEFASTYFNGGGHANASGGVFEGNMNEAITKLKEALNKEFK